MKRECPPHACINTCLMQPGNASEASPIETASASASAAAHPERSTTMNSLKPSSIQLQWIGYAPNTSRSQIQVGGRASRKASDQAGDEAGSCAAAPPKRKGQSAPIPVPCKDPHTAQASRHPNKAPYIGHAGHTFSSKAKVSGKFIVIKWAARDALQAAQVRSQRPNLRVAKPSKDEHPDRR